MCRREFSRSQCPPWHGVEYPIPPCPPLPICETHHSATAMHIHITVVCVWFLAKLATFVSQSLDSGELPPWPITNYITAHVEPNPSLGMCLCVKSGPSFSIPSFDASGLLHTATAVLFLVLQLCGDVQLNPGLKCKSVYPCRYCEHNVDYGTKAIFCDNYYTWFHKFCVSMSSAMYSELNSKKDWFCYRCFTHNCEPFHAHEYSVDTSNSFSAPMTASENDVFISPLSQRPQAHNSPHDTQPAATAAHIPSYSSSNKAPSRPSSRYAYDPLKKGDHWRTPVLNINSIFGKAAAFCVCYPTLNLTLCWSQRPSWKIISTYVLPSDLGYTVYKKDRMNEGGGGVALLVKSCHSSTKVTPADEASISSELMWVEVELHGHRKLLTFSFYHRLNVNNSSQLEVRQSSLETIMSNYSGPTNHWF